MAGVKFTIGADSKKASAELNSFKKKTDGIAKSIAKGFKERVGQRIFDGLIVAARKIPLVINEAINTAADLNEEIDKSSVVFGQGSHAMQQFAESAVKSMNISKLEAMKYTGTLGGLFKTIGMNNTQVQEMSKRMVRLAADLGSLHNMKTEDAIFAIGAALRGESEPIRKFNVLLNEATLKAEAMAQGLYDGKGALDPATKALAAYHVILRQTTDAHGNAEATASSYQNQKKKLAAQMENLSAEIGETFLPLMRDVVTTINQVDFKPIADTVNLAAEGFRSYAKDIENVYNEIETLLSKSPRLEKFTKMLLFGFVPTLGTKELSEDPLKKAGIVPDFLKEDDQNKEISQAEEFLSVLDEIEQLERDRAKAKIENIQIEEEQARIMKEHDERMKASLHAERERLELLKKQKEEREKAEAIEKAQSKLDETTEGISQIQSKFESAMTRSSLTAVSSMQRIGGGGGVVGELNLQKTQTDLQRQLVDLQQKMVGLLEQVKTATGQQPVSQG